MIDFSLEYYRAFYYVARLGSVSKAADALFLSQPAVTHSIKQLEKNLCCTLFTRVPRGMQLTAEGSVLFRHIDEAFGEILAGEKALKQMVTYISGQIEIGATETAIYNFLLPHIAAFRKVQPKVYIHVTGSSTPDTISMLRGGNVDIAIAVTPLSEVDDLSVVEMSSIQDIFVVGPAFKHLADRNISVEDICHYPIVTVEKGTSARRHLDTWFQEQGIIFDPEYSVRTSTTVLPFVEHDLAVGIIPSFFVEDKITQGQLFKVNVDHAIPKRKIVILTKKQEAQSLVCRRFIKQLQDDPAL